ncbi:hypothetical protein BaRGS_00000113, partial [Batillaria attramentaria]
RMRAMGPIHSRLIHPVSVAARRCMLADYTRKQLNGTELSKTELSSAVRYRETDGLIAILDVLYISREELADFSCTLVPYRHDLPDVTRGLTTVTDSSSATGGDLQETGEKMAPKMAVRMQPDAFVAFRH